jgi:hypothetical protein
MENEITKNQRLNSFVEYLKSQRKIFNNADFAKILGKQPSFISECLSGKRKISDVFIHSIKSAFPSLNEEWLLTGEGSMIYYYTKLYKSDKPIEEIIAGMDPKIIEALTNNTQKEKPFQENSVLIQQLLTTIQEQSRTIGVLEERIRQSEEQQNNSGCNTRYA